MGHDQRLKNKIVSAILSYPPDSMSKAEFMADQILAALSHEWRPISEAPKAPANGSKWWGPKILISTTHHGHQVTFIGRFHHGAHKRFMDTADGSCVSAGDDGDLWIPLPTPPATGGDGG
jgi:hypothetical protein